MLSYESLSYISSSLLTSLSMKKELLREENADRLPGEKNTHCYFA
ncbi:hypothetical protein CCY16_00135 [Wolbachia endosymbiont of Wuchereria bancrofti]|nr:hypothetical protein CCY16_00135 [Wolbachia endosymbiont of Wuchereria bancrofti]